MIQYAQLYKWIHHIYNPKTENSCDYLKIFAKSTDIVNYIFMFKYPQRLHIEGVYIITTKAINDEFLIENFFLRLETEKECQFSTHILHHGTRIPRQRV